MDGVAQLSAQERAELFTQTAAEKGIQAVIVEKDFWVCWTLSRLFGLGTEQPGMIFKGGTSLAKVFGVIERFSEDIDVSLDRHDLGFVDDRDPEAAGLSGKAVRRLLQQLQTECSRYVLKM